MGSATLIPPPLPGTLKCVHLFWVLGSKEKVRFLSLKAVFEVRGTKGIKSSHHSLRSIAILVGRVGFTEYLQWAHHCNRCHNLKQWIPQVISNRPPPVRTPVASPAAAQHLYVPNLCASLPFPIANKSPLSQQEPIPSLDTALPVWLPRLCTTWSRCCHSPCSLN